MTASGSCPVRRTVECNFGILVQQLSNLCSRATKIRSSLLILAPLQVYSLPAAVIGPHEYGAITPCDIVCCVCVFLSTTMCLCSHFCVLRDTVYQPFLASSTCDVLRAQLFAIGVRMHPGGRKTGAPNVYNLSIYLRYRTCLFVDIHLVMTDVITLILSHSLYSSSFSSFEMPHFIAAYEKNRSLLYVCIERPL